MVLGLTRTPRYVLNDGTMRICPLVLDSEGNCSTVIYGFADKPEYDAFMSSNDTLLTPYPLVKRYLETELESRDDNLHLIVLDAASPREKFLSAATFQSVLLALQMNDSFVRVTHRLLLEEGTSQYRIVSILPPDVALAANSKQVDEQTGPAVECSEGCSNE